MAPEEVSQLLSPRSGLPRRHHDPRLAPWAALFRRFAADPVIAPSHLFGQLWAATQTTEALLHRHPYIFPRRTDQRPQPGHLRSLP